MGMVSFVTDDALQKSLEIAEKMIQNLSPHGLALTKRGLASSADGNSLHSQIHTENLTQVLLLRDPEAQDFAKEYLKKFSKPAKL